MATKSPVGKQSDPVKPGAKVTGKPGSAQMGNKTTQSGALKGGKGVVEKNIKPERRPLYEPKYRVKLPPRVTRKIKRWPSIQIPPLILRKWQPDRKKKKIEKPVVEIPPFKTRPWKPAGVKKPKPKPQVDYPPLKIRKTPWKPKIRDHDPKVKRHVVMPPRLEQTFFPAKISTLGKNWHQFKQVGPKCMILRGNYSQTSKKFNFISNDRQSAAIAIMAISYSNVFKLQGWMRTTCDEILDCGDTLFKTSITRAREKSVNFAKPTKIYPYFFINFVKISVLVGNEISSSDFNNNDKDSIEKLVSNMSGILDNYGSCIIYYHGSNYGVWKEGSSYYCFNPNDCDDKGTPVAKYTGKCCVIRMPSIALLMEYVALVLKPEMGKYEIYSFRILGITELDKNPPEEPFEKAIKKTKSDYAIAKLVTINIIPQREVFRTIVLPVKEEKVVENRLKDIIDSTVPAEFSNDYRQTIVTHPRRGILRGMEYLKESIRAPCINVAAIAMLRVSKANAWETNTIDEIFVVGNSIYEENVEKVEGDEVLATEVSSIIKIGKKSFEIDSEHYIYGKLISSSIDFVSLHTGLEQFFQMYDAGVLQGPQSVAVWHEMNFYYMFDPKERDGTGRKWHKGSPMVSDGRVGGVACILYYEDLHELIHCYMDNVPTKYKYDPYKITRIDIRDFIAKAEDFNNWKGITPTKWIIRGTYTQDADIFARSSRNNQATCIAAIALAYKNIYDVLEWTFEQVDTIIQSGDDFYMASVANLKNENKFVHKHLTVNEIVRFFVVDEQNIFFDVDECCINGSLIAKLDDEIIDLRQGFKQFFMQNESGILTSCSVSYAFWRSKSVFYVFDSYPRDANGRNVKTSSPDSMLISDLQSCVLRFSKISDFVHHIASNLELQDSPIFNLSKVEATVLKEGERPPLYNYKPFLKYEFAAILRPFGGLHEDHDKYGIKNNQKTLFNLICGLAMTQIAVPEKWKQSDICTILRIGNKWFLKTMSALRIGEKLTWDHLSKDIEVGATVFCFNREEMKCSFHPKPKTWDDEELEKEEMLNPLASDSKLKRMSTTSVAASPAPSASDTSAMEESGAQSSIVLLPQYDLQSMLESWSKDMQKDAILESDLFKLAIWKRNKLFFIFDCKCAKEDGSLTIQRFIQIKHALLERERTRAVKTLTGGASTISIKSGLVELTEGMVKVFDLPKKTPSLPDIQAVIDKGTFDHRVKDPENEELGSAYVAWFTSADLVVEYILKLVSEEYKEEEFTMHIIKLEYQKADPKKDTVAGKWNHFVPIERGHWMLRATLSQNDPLFLKMNRNNQDVPNCVTCLAIISSCPSPEWNTFMMDTILKYGDRLYTKTVNEIRKSQALPIPGKLTLTQVIPKFTIDSTTKITLAIKLLVHGDITAADDNQDTKNLLKGFKQFFDMAGAYAVILAKDIYIAIWKAENFLFMFSPHSLGPDGKKRPIGVACIERFETLEDFERAYLEKLDYSFGLNDYKIFDIKIVKSTIEGGISNICDTDSEETMETVPRTERIVLPKRYTAYQILRSGARGIYGDTAENYPVYGCDPESRVPPPTSCHAVAAHAMMKCQNVEYWTAKTIDEILILGMKLFEQTKKISGAYIVTHPQEVIRSFNMNKVFITVTMELFSRGHVTSRGGGDESLKSGIFKFLELHANGILIVGNLTLAFWKLCGLFYVFCPMPMNSIGRIFDGGRACLLSFSTLEMLLDSVKSNLEINEMENKDADAFEIRKCDIVRSIPKDSNDKGKEIV